MDNPNPKDLLRILLAAALWGLCYVTAKVASSLLHPIIFTSVLALICTGWALFFGRPKLVEIPRAFRRAPWTLLGLGFFGMVLGNILLYYALNRVGVGVGSVLAKLEPIFTVIFAAVLLGERLRGVQLGYLLLAVSGALGISSSSVTSGEVTLLPLIALLVTAASWGMSTVLGKSAITQGFTPDQASFYRFGLGAIMTLPLLLLIDHSEFMKLADPRALFLVTFTGGVGCYAFIIFYRGLKTVPAGVAGAIELITPLVAAVIGALVLGESWSPLQLAASAVLLFGVYRVSSG